MNESEPSLAEPLPMGTVDQGFLRELGLRKQVEALQAEVRRLQELVRKVSRTPPAHTLWGGDLGRPDELDDWLRRQVVEYKIELRVPDWPLLSCRMKLDRHWWEQDFWEQMFDITAHEAHNKLITEIKGRRWQ